MASGLDWTIVRPGRLTDARGTGTVDAARALGRRGEITRDDTRSCYWRLVRRAWPAWPSTCWRARRRWAWPWTRSERQLRLGRGAGGDGRVVAFPLLRQLRSQFRAPQASRRPQGITAGPAAFPGPPPPQETHMFAADNHVIRLAGDADEAALERSPSSTPPRPLEHPILSRRSDGPRGRRARPRRRRAIADPFLPGPPTCGPSCASAPRRLRGGAQARRRGPDPRRRRNRMAYA